MTCGFRVGSKSAVLIYFLLGVTKMLETIAIILIVFWALGLVSSYTMGGFIHILLILAIVVILMRVIRGRSL